MFTFPPPRLTQSESDDAHFNESLKALFPPLSLILPSDHAYVLTRLDKLSYHVMPSKPVFLLLSVLTAPRPGLFKADLDPEINFSTLMSQESLQQLSESALYGPLPFMELPSLFPTLGF